MSRYIDAIKTAEILSERHKIPLSVLVDIFAEVPTADVAEVVRCKDCKHFDKNKAYRDTKFSFSFCDKFHYNIKTENDFCSYGARMDGMDGDME